MICSCELLVEAMVSRLVCTPCLLDMGLNGDKAGGGGSGFHFLEIVQIWV